MSACKHKPLERTCPDCDFERGRRQVEELNLTRTQFRAAIRLEMLREVVERALSIGNAAMEREAVRMIAEELRKEASKP